MTGWHSIGIGGALGQWAGCVRHGQARNTHSANSRETEMERNTRWCVNGTNSNTQHEVGAGPRQEGPDLSSGRRPPAPGAAWRRRCVEGAEQGVPEVSRGRAPVGRGRGWGGDILQLSPSSLSPQSHRNRIASGLARSGCSCSGTGVGLTGALI